MKKIIIFFILCLSVFANDKKNILYINSYHPAYPTFFQQLKGIKDGFKNEDITLDIEFLDSKRFGVKKLYPILLKDLTAKLKTLEKYDLIIASDDNATDFVIKNHEILFKNTPVVFFGVNDKNKVKLYNKNPLFTGYYEESSMYETIELAHKLFPKSNKIYAISDSTESSKGDLETYYKLKDKFSNLELEVLDLSKLSFSELYEDLYKLKNNSLVLLLSAYVDKNNSILDFKESLEHIMKNSSVPIFHLWEHGLGDGIIGGKLISHYEYGYIAAKTADSILHNEMFFMPLDQNLTIYSFDYNILKKYKVDMTLLPKNTKIINKPISPYLKKIIIIFLVATSTLGLIVLLLINNIIKVKNSKQEIQLAKIKYQKLFENLPISIWEEDLSPVLEEFQKLKAQGIEDFEAYLENDPVLVYQYSSMIEVIDVNKATLKLHKAKSKDELLGNLQKTFSKSSYISFKKLLTALWNKDTSISVEGVVKTLTGENIHVSLSWSLYDKNKCIVSILDITKQYQYQNELLAAKSIAEEANKAKSSFLANMSHEIRTPLTGIIGMMELLSLTELNEEQQEYLKSVNSSSEKLIAIVNDILDISKIENGKIILENESFIFEDFFYKLVNSFNFNIEKKGLKFYIYINPKLFKNYIGDADKISHILTNLLGNALKFTKEGFICFKAECLNSSEQYDEIEFSVSDTGVGIAEENLKTIFNPFTQEDISFSKNFQGTGLGLSISKKMAELMNGQLKVESTKSYGSTFSFTVKLEKSKYFKDNRSLKNKNIAFFSNNDINFSFVKDILVYEDANLKTAHNKNDFYDILNSENIDFVIIDYIPNNWIEFFTTLNKDFKICFITSSLEKKNMNFEFDSYEIFYIKKPIERSELIKIIKEE